MAIRWKVVGKGRKSCIACGELKMTYPKGVVKAFDGTPGVMVFKTRKQAIEWLGECAFNGNENLKVLKVRTWSRGRRPKMLLNAGSHSLYRVRRYLKDLFDGFSRATIESDSTVWVDNWHVGLWPVPPGTLCYKEVEVLE